MPDVDEARYDEAIPKKAITEKPGRSAVFGDGQRQLDNWVSQFLMFGPLLTYHDVKTNHDSANSHNEASPPQGWPHPGTHNLSVIKRRFSIVNAMQNLFVTDHQKFWNVGVNQISPIVFRRCEPEGV